MDISGGDTNCPRGQVHYKAQRTLRPLSDWHLHKISVFDEHNDPIIQSNFNLDKLKLQKQTRSQGEATAEGEAAFWSKLVLAVRFAQNLSICA